MDEYESLTRAWIKAKEDAESDKIKAQRNELTSKLEHGYWKMDKYLRGRTLYDRTGVLKPDGGLEFYPEKKKAEQAPAQTSNNDID